MGPCGLEHVVVGMVERVAAAAVGRVQVGVARAWVAVGRVLVVAVRV